MALARVLVNMGGHRSTPKGMCRRGAASLLLCLAVILSACQSEGRAGDGRGQTAAGPGKEEPEKQPAPPREERRSFTIAATGDILIHSQVADRALAYGGSARFDFAPMFDPVEPLLEGADLALCHMETPISPDNQGLSSYPIFSVPREIASAAANAGYDYCSTASNHSLDQGAAGVQATLDVLDRAGLEHEGTARSAKEARAPTIVKANGVKVGLLSYTYGLNGFVELASTPWLVNVNDAGAILDEARRSRAAGAEFVIVSLHGGLEYQSAPSAEQVALSRRLLKSRPVDLVIGHHAHVVQPVDRIGGKYVFYGMGNFLSNQSPECCVPQTQDGVIVRLEIADRGGSFRVVHAGYTPTYVRRDSYRIIPTDPRTKRGDPELRAELKLSFQRTRTALNSLGAYEFGLRPDKL
ncbi:MAG: CapA family protein [Actinobacteria bacterium]|nr:CapA family protein [Actinomycetota bacterium]